YITSSTSRGGRVLSASLRVGAECYGVWARSVIFFFSSRRRHTRLQGDWSSDVCSSDLIPNEVRSPGSVSGSLRSSKVIASYFPRSEERRVGKECRSRWSPAH